MKLIPAFEIEHTEGYITRVFLYNVSSIEEIVQHSGTGVFRNLENLKMKINININICVFSFGFSPCGYLTSETFPEIYSQPHIGA